MAEAIDYRTERARADFIRQPRAQCFHLEARGQRLALVMLRERVEREAFQRVPSGPRGESFFVADRQFDEARCFAERGFGLGDRNVHQGRDPGRAEREAFLQIDQRFDSVGAG